MSSHAGSPPHAGCVAARDAVGTRGHPAGCHQSRPCEGHSCGRETRGSVGNRPCLGATETERARTGRSSSSAGPSRPSQANRRAVEALSKGKGKAPQGLPRLGSDAPVPGQCCSGQSPALPGAARASTALHWETLVAVARVAVGATMAPCDAQGARPGRGDTAGRGEGAQGAAPPLMAFPTLLANQRNSMQAHGPEQGRQLLAGVTSEPREKPHA